MQTSITYRSLQKSSILRRHSVHRQPVIFPWPSQLLISFRRRSLPILSSARARWAYIPDKQRMFHLEVDLYCCILNSSCEIRLSISYQRLWSIHSSIKSSDQPFRSNINTHRKTGHPLLNFTKVERVFLIIKILAEVVDGKEKVSKGDHNIKHCPSSA